MKVNKKQMILGVILVSFLVFCYVTLLPHDTNHVMKLNQEQKNIRAVKSENNNSSDIFKNLYSFAIKINNEVLQVPTDLKDFIEDGWKSVNEIGEDTFEFVPIEHTEFIKNGTVANVMIDSVEVYPLTMDKYYVSSLIVTEDLYKNDKVELPKNIVLASSHKEDIIEAYGEPNDIWSYENEPERMFYKYDKNQVIMFSLNEQGLLSEIMLTYEKPKTGLNFSVIDTQQKAPERLSDKFNGSMFMLDDVIYNLPGKIKPLIEQGWKPVDDIEFVADGANEKLLIDFKKGNQVVNVELRNPNDEPAPIEECYIVSATFELDKCQDFGFAGGFNQSSTLEDFRKLSQDFQVKEVHVDMGEDVMTAFRIKTGKSSQFEVLMNYEDNSKIRGFRISNYPK